MKNSSKFIRFHNEFGLEKAIDIFSEAGFEGIDFNFDMDVYCKGNHSKEFFAGIKDYAKERGIVFGHTHAPFESSYPEEDKTKNALRKL